MTTAAAPHWPVGIQRVASGKPDETSVFQAGVDPAFVDHRLPMAGSTKFDRPTNISRQGIPAHNAPVPCTGPDSPVGHGRGCQTAFTFCPDRILPGPQDLAGTSVAGLEAIAG